MTRQEMIIISIPDNLDIFFEESEQLINNALYLGLFDYEHNALVVVSTIEECVRDRVTEPNIRVQR